MSTESQYSLADDPGIVRRFHLGGILYSLTPVTYAWAVAVAQGTTHHALMVKHVAPVRVKRRHGLSSVWFDRYSEETI